MNTDLMTVVEQVVRPLPALKANKLRMRIELYSLLQQIYEEELSRPGASETTALQQASRRFGDPNALSEELLQTIPTSERVWAMADRVLVRRREGEGLVRFSLRIGLHSIVGMVLFGLILFLMATFLKNDPPDLTFWLWWALATATVGVNSFCLTILGNAALAGFHGKGERTGLRNALRLGACSVAAGLMIAFSEIVNMFYLVGSHWKLGYVEPLVCVWLITGVMFAVVVWLRSREDVQFQPWNDVVLPPRQSAKRGTA